MGAGGHKYISWAFCAMAVSFGKISPEVLTEKVQKISPATLADGSSFPTGRSPADELINAFLPFDKNFRDQPACEVQSIVQSVGYVVKTLARILQETVNEGSRQLFMAPMVKLNGIGKLKTVLENLQ